MINNYQKKSIELKMKYPAIDDLAIKAQKRIPHVAWEYLQTGTGREELIQRNLDAIQNVRLNPQFCKGSLNPVIETSLFGQKYNAPFGIAPVGLTGLMWPRAEVILAKTAHKYQIPYSLSTVATETPETVGPHVGDMGWFQLYPPREKELRKAFIDRAWAEQEPECPEDDSLLLMNRLPMRRYRPRRHVQVLCEGDSTGYRPAFNRVPSEKNALPHQPPAVITSGDFKGRIVDRRGPFSTSGNWWEKRNYWRREEWDVEHENGRIYRLVKEKGEWFVEAAG